MVTAVTIEDAREERRALERSVNEAVTKFEARTGLRIERIDVDTVTRALEHGERIVSRQIKARVEGL